MEVASKKDVEQIVDRKLEDVKNELLHALDQIGKPERITSGEVAEEWGVTRKTAIKRLKKMHRKGELGNVDFDSRPITVDRKEFFKSISKV